MIDSGGLYSQLEWLAPHGVVPIRLGLAVVNAPSWSPDGKLIMFGGVPPHAGVDVATLPTDLYTIDPRAPRQLHLVIGGLTDFRPSGAGWMRNSKWVVIGMQPPGQPSGLWIIDVTNGHKALLVAGTEFGRATVSPTGRSVAVGVGVDAEIDPALNVKPPRVGIDIIPLPPQELLSKMLH